MQVKSKLLSGCLLSLAIGLVLICSSQSCAQSPPLITDDPGTPGDGRWEINIVSSMEKTRVNRSFEAPLLDINYGVGRNLQLKFEVPWLVLHSSEDEPKGGLGNMNVGVKWRFMDEDEDGIDLSVYPQMEFKSSTESVEGGLSEPAPQFLIPVQALHTFGPVELVGEVGYNIVKHGPNETFYGVAAGGNVSRRVELLGELFGSSENHFHENELVFNIGSIVEINRKVNLVFAVGRTIINEADEGPGYLATVGVQFNFRAPLWRKRSPTIRGTLPGRGTPSVPD
jgi:hypothetical protein